MCQYAKQKGFCEDLDEGKYSLPLIHALRGSKDSGGSGEDNYNTVLAQSLLSGRHAGGPLSLDQKKLLLQLIKDRGGLDYTRKALNALHGELKKLVAQLGMHGGERLTGLFESLKV
jgi:geranylgeranyl pyrophosphate synthase